MRGLEDFMFDVLEEDVKGILLCVLSNEIFCESAAVTTTKLHEATIEDERRFYKSLASIRQLIEIQYGIFNMFCIFQNKEAFKLLSKAELVYWMGIIVFFC